MREVWQTLIPLDEPVICRQCNDNRVEENAVLRQKHTRTAGCTFHSSCLSHLCVCIVFKMCVLLNLFRDLLCHKRCDEDKRVCFLSPEVLMREANHRFLTAVVIWFWRLVQQMGGVMGGWSVFGAPSLKRVGVCAQGALWSVFRQTDSWSNKLRRAVGSLDSDLSPLGPLYSSYGQNCFHCIVAVVAGGALLTMVWRQPILQRNQKTLTFSLPCAKVFSSLCVLLWLSVTGCTVPPALPLPFCVCCSVFVFCST